MLAMFGNPLGQDVAWKFLKAHWDEFKPMYEGLHGLTRLVEGVGHMVGEDVLKDVKSFFSTHPEKDIMITIRQVIEKIEANTSWQQRDLPRLTAFLSKNS